MEEESRDMDLVPRGADLVPKGRLEESRGEGDAHRGKKIPGGSLPKDTQPVPSKAGKQHSQPAALF